MQGRLQGEVDATCAQIGLRGRELHPEGGEFIQFLFTKSETLDSCRFEPEMRQNAPNPISISIFRGNTPDPCHWGLCPRPPGRGGRG